jgi:hypothetical protein
MPTIGNTSATGGLAGTSNLSQGHRYAAYHYTAVAGDYIDQFFIYATGNSATPIYLAAYSVAAGIPANRLAAAITITPTAVAGLRSSALVNQPLVAGVTYTIAFLTTAVHAVMRDIIADPRDSRDAVTPLPAVWGEDSSRTYTYLYYANVANAPPPVTADILYPCCAQLIT